MTTTPEPTPKTPWTGMAFFVAALLMTTSLGMLLFSIQERRREATAPLQLITPIAELEPDSAVWGKNFPRQYQSMQRSEEAGDKTKYGGPQPFSQLEADPLLKQLFAGYPFAVEYNEERGHFYALQDIRATARRDPKRGGKPQPGTCLTCKSSNVPGLMAKMTPGKFYQAKFDEVNKQIHQSIGCADCHDAKTLNLRISRPALREAFQSMGKDVDKASYQEMRSLVCAQCHVEYFFAKQPGEKKGTYLTFPWAKGTTVEQMEAYYTENGHVDWEHKVSKTKMIKMQHPDYEIFQTGIHAANDVACADCHMPYRTEGGIKFTDHHVQSPLKNIRNSCGVCHGWSDAEVTARVYSIQDKTKEVMERAEKALVAAHEEIGKAMAAGATDAQLAGARELVRRAQLRWDYVAAGNGMGIHAPQECARILASAIDLAQQARLAVAKMK
ncbi:MAG: ammonia-forming cytochrome c nitrite reductase subunit c552 [Armatimonadota bacterium]